MDTCCIYRDHTPLKSLKQLAFQELLFPSEIYFHDSFPPGESFPQERTPSPQISYSQVRSYPLLGGSLWGDQRFSPGQNLHGW